MSNIFKYLLLYLCVLAAIKTGETLKHVSFPKIGIEITQYSDGDKFQKCGYLARKPDGSVVEECWTREIIKAYDTYVVYNLVTGSGFKLKTKALLSNDRVESDGWEEV